MTETGDPGQGYPGQQPNQGFPSAPPPPQYDQPQYGQQYGQQAPPPYAGGPQYSQYPQFPGGGDPGYGFPPGPPGIPAGVQLAGWGARAGATLLDGLFNALMAIPGGILLGIGAGEDIPALIAVGVIVLVAAVGVSIYQVGWLQGNTGYSWGKGIVGIKLVREADGNPVGGGTGIGRMLLRWLLGAITYNIYSLLTYLWPLWDKKNQTLDDKIFHSLVIRAPKPPKQG